MTTTAPAETLLPLPADDAVVVFRTERSNMHGRLVRLGPAIDKILKAHDVPAPASMALGEAVALAALLGSALPGEGRFSVQARCDGAVPALYADCEAPGKLRGYARFDAQAVKGDSDGGTAAPENLLGNGHMAFTIEQGAEAQRYQGVVATGGVRIDQTAARYFESRENIPTFMRLAVATLHEAPVSGGAAHSVWRAGGIMMQSTAAPGDDDGTEAWARVHALVSTIEDHELLDAAISAERLLLRLFHEEGVIIERVVPLVSYCKCSRERIVNVLAAFTPDEVAGMYDGAGRIVVSCEFCAATYAFEPNEIVARET